MNKIILRSSISKKIKEYPDYYKKKISENICLKIESDSDFINSESVGLYVPMKDEVDIISIINKYHLRKKIFLPYIEDTSNCMDYVLFRGWDKMNKSKFGILQPYICDNIVSGYPELLIVPALAFDKDGYRLGRGGGYYDRFLKSNVVKTIGVSLFSFVELERDIWDIPVEKVFNSHSL